MKLTLLELVQDMLSAIDSENVSSVGDTEEAGMCVNIANRAFEDIISSFRWRHTKELVTLSTTSALNELVLPSNAIAIDPYNIWYDGNPITYRYPEDFLNFTILRDETDSSITTSNNVKVYNDRDPIMVTSFDDETMIFDGYNGVSGLDGNKCVALVYTAPTSRLTDDDQYFDLPAQAYPALENRCIALALRELKGDTGGYNAANRDYVKQRAALARNARLVDRHDDLRKHVVARPSMRNVVNRTTRIIP